MEAVGLTEPISSLPVRWRSALRDTALNMRRRYQRHLPQVLAAADDESVVGIGTASGFSAVAKIAVNNGAIGGMAVSPDGSRLVVTNYGDNSVSIIHTGTYAVVNTVAGTGEPFAIAVGNAAHNCAYVSTASASYDAIVAVDLSSNVVVATHPVALSVSDLAVSPDGKYVYASRSGVGGADVAVLDTATRQTDAINIAAAPGTTTGCLRISSDGQRLYVATHGPSGGELIVIDTGTERVIDTVEIGSAIRDVALSTDSGTAYVASCDPDFGAVVDIIDARTHIVNGRLKTGEIDGFLTQLALSDDGERAYLVGDEGVMVLCTLTQDVTGIITVGTRPSCVIESRGGSYLYVADYSGAVTVISMASTTASPVHRTVGDEIVAEPDLPQLESVLT